MRPYCVVQATESAEELTAAGSLSEDRSCSGVGGGGGVSRDVRAQRMGGGLRSRGCRRYRRVRASKQRTCIAPPAATITTTPMRPCPRTSMVWLMLMPAE